MIAELKLPSFEQRVVDRLGTWVSTHPSPDTVIFSGGPDGRVLSPRQIHQEVANRTDFGLQRLDSFKRGAMEFGEEAVLMFICSPVPFPPSSQHEI